MSERTQTIRRIVQEHGRIPNSIDGVADTDSLYNVGLTSHATVNVMLALEDEFDIEFPERFLNRSTFETIASLRAAIGSIMEEG